MIDAYRDLLAEHDAEVSAAADRFRSRLSQLLAGDQVIEAPEEPQDRSPAVPPATQPGQGERVPATGRTEPESAPATTPARAPKPRGENRTTCNNCGRSDFRSAAARGNHEKYCKGTGSQRLRAPAEVFLCDSCDAPFDSREALNAHRPCTVRRLPDPEPNPDVVAVVGGGLVERNPRSVPPLELRRRSEAYPGQ